MNRLYKIQFSILLIILFVVLSYKTYEQYRNIQATQKLLILNESEVLSSFIKSFRTTYQDAFVKNHIEVTNQTMKLLPVQTIGEISKRFSSSLSGSVIIRTVSDRPRNPDNMANTFELEMMDLYRKNPKLDSKFIQIDENYYFTKPLYIEPMCMKCHGKREEAVPSIRAKYENAYDYKLGDLRGLLSVEIKDRKFFSLLYDDLKNNVIISICMFMVLGFLIYILVRKIFLMEQNYTIQLKEEVAKKTEDIKKQNIAFETVFEKSLQGSLIIKDSKIIQCNLAIVRMLKYSSKKELRNLNLVQLSPEFQPDGKSSVEKSDEMMALAMQKNGYSFEWLNCCFNGKDVWTYITLTPISLPDGDIIHVSLTDISKRKELEEKIQYHTESLETKNKELDSLVREEFAKSQKQEKILFEQSRMAQMGEMISMIAHQWRQPLAAIASTSIDLNLKISLDTFDVETEEGRGEAQAYFEKSLKQIDSLVQNLTTTIDDFRNFYKPNKQKEKSLLTIPVQKAYELCESSLKMENIKITQEYSSKDELDIYANELMQVIINIVQNAKDNFLSKEIKYPEIMIKTFDTDNSVVIKICDNGGGIDDLVLSRIFDPYFSTKTEKNGTGLGLYMSKTIVVEHHNGLLSAENIDDGVCFKIEIFKEEETNEN